MPRAEIRRVGWLGLIGSVKLGVVSLTVLMLLVVACTLAQVHLGTFGAVDVYIRRFFIYAVLPGTHWRVPVLPGGGFVGLVLAANLVAGLLLRPEWARARPGLFLSHLGVLLLVGGEFVTGAFADEALMSIEVGSSRGWAESRRKFELALVDISDPARVRVYAIPASRLRRRGDVDDPRLPFRVGVEFDAANARLDPAPGGGFTARPVPETTADDEMNTPAATILLADRTRMLVSAQLEPAHFAHGGRRFTIALRPTRSYLPFALALKRFTHETYPGTDIPRNFASLVRLTDAERGEDRDALISMNHPLRYRGRTFYQASYGKGDTLSIFQVVRNPGWLLPYVSCALVALGLAWHFLILLRAGGRPRA